MNALAISFWRQDVLRPIKFQWAALLFVCAITVFVEPEMAINAAIGGLGVLIPNTALGAWMGVRAFLGKVGMLGVLLGSVVKTFFSLVLMGSGFAFLQTSVEIGWVWQGFLAGLVSVVFAPIVHGITQKT